MKLISTLAPTQTSDNPLDQLAASVALAPAVRVNLTEALSPGAIGRVQLPPSRPKQQSAQPRQQHRARHQHAPIVAPNTVPGDSVTPPPVRMVALRRTMGDGLFSGQIMIRTQDGWTLDAKSKCDFIVTAIYLPCGLEALGSDAIVQDQTAWMPYDEGYRSQRDSFWGILEIKVGADSKPWVRACDMHGTPYETKDAWVEMTVDTVRLRMLKQEQLAAVRSFTGLEYPVWSHGGRYDKGLLGDREASILAHRMRLA